MKVLKKKMIWFGAVLLTGIVLFVVNLLRGGDDFINGFSCAITAVAAVKMLQLIRISRNPEWLKRFQIEQKEERVIMLAQKSGYFTLLLTLAVEILVGIVLMFIETGDNANWLLMIAAAQSFLYLVSYLWLSKKY